MMKKKIKKPLSILEFLKRLIKKLIFPKKKPISRFNINFKWFIQGIFEIYRFIIFYIILSRQNEENFKLDWIFFLEIIEIIYFFTNFTKNFNYIMISLLEILLFLTLFEVYDRKIWYLLNFARVFRLKFHKNIYYLIFLSIVFEFNWILTTEKINHYELDYNVSFEKLIKTFILLSEGIEINNDLSYFIQIIPIFFFLPLLYAYRKESKQIKLKIINPKIKTYDLKSFILGNWVLNNSFLPFIKAILNPYKIYLLKFPNVFIGFSMKKAQEILYFSPFISKNMKQSVLLFGIIKVKGSFKLMHCDMLIEKDDYAVFWSNDNEKSIQFFQNFKLKDLYSFDQISDMMSSTLEPPFLLEDYFPNNEINTPFQWFFIDDSNFKIDFSNHLLIIAIKTKKIEALINILVKFRSKNQYIVIFLQKNLFNSRLFNDLFGTYHNFIVLIGNIWDNNHIDRLNLNKTKQIILLKLKSDWKTIFYSYFWLQSNSKKIFLYQKNNLIHLFIDEKRILKKSFLINFAEELTHNKILNVFFQIIKLKTLKTLIINQRICEFFKNFGNFIWYISRTQCNWLPLGIYTYPDKEFIITPNLNLKLTENSELLILIVDNQIYTQTTDSYFQVMNSMKNMIINDTRRELYDKLNKIYNISGVLPIKRRIEIKDDLIIALNNFLLLLKKLDKNN